MSTYTNKRLRREAARDGARMPDYVGKKRKAPPAEQPMPKTADSIYRDAMQKTAELNLRTQGVWGVELKSFTKSIGKHIPIMSDTARTLYEGTGGTALLCLNGIGAGSDVNQRDGNKYTIMSFQMQGVLKWQRKAQLADGFSRSASVVRIALVEDYQTNGAMMVASDCFNYSNAGTPLSVAVTRNIAGESRFKVHKWWNFFWEPKVNEYGATDIEMQAYCEDLSCYLGNLKIPVECKDSADTVASIGTHSLHLVTFLYDGTLDAGDVFTESPVGTTPEVIVRYQIRFVG